MVLLLGDGEGHSWLLPLLVRRLRRLRLCLIKRRLLRLARHRTLQKLRRCSTRVSGHQPLGRVLRWRLGSCPRVAHGLLSQVLLLLLLLLLLLMLL